MPSPVTMPSTETVPAPPILAATGLTKVFESGGKEFRAVDNVSLHVAEGGVLGIVGESGSGKSTVARLVMRLVEPTAGLILFEGEDLTSKSGEALRRVRRRMQIVFQTRIRRSIRATRSAARSPNPTRSRLGFGESRSNGGSIPFSTS